MYTDNRYLLLDTNKQFKLVNIWEIEPFFQLMYAKVSC